MLCIARILASSKWNSQVYALSLKDLRDNTLILMLKWTYFVFLELANKVFIIFKGKKMASYISLNCKLNNNLYKLVLLGELVISSERYASALWSRPELYQWEHDLCLTTFRRISSSEQVSFASHLLPSFFRLWFCSQYSYYWCSRICYIFLVLTFNTAYK